MLSTLPSFSHIYVEESIAEHENTLSILAKFPKAERISIRDYKEVFNRPRQNWKAQKRSMKLILARKKQDFLYRGSNVAPDFGYEHFFYNALMLNCLYDCHYCYLQGMYGSANVVMFMNLEDYFQETDQTLKTHSPLYLCLSYDSDLLAFSSLFPYAARWIEFAASRPDLVIEIRSKSAAVHSLLEFQPLDNVVLAWTLSPQAIIERFEPKTPSLRARLSAMKKLVDRGWKLRVCLDPVLDVPNWQAMYRECIEHLCTELPAESVREISIGTYRMNKEYFKQVNSIRPHSELRLQKLENVDGLMRIRDAERHNIQRAVCDMLRSYVPAERVSVVET